MAAPEDRERLVIESCALRDKCDRGLTHCAVVRRRGQLCIGLVCRPVRLDTVRCLERVDRAGRATQADEGRLENFMNNATGDSAADSASRKRGLFRRIIATFLKIAGALAALVIIAGFMYEFIGRHQDERHFPQEGQSIDVGGYRLNLRCTGAGSPTVILESGLGVTAIGWKAV